MRNVFTVLFLSASLALLAASCSPQKARPEHAKAVAQAMTFTACTPAAACGNPCSYAISGQVWGEEVSAACGSASAYSALLSCATTFCQGPTRCGEVPPSDDAEDLITQNAFVGGLSDACGACLTSMCGRLLDACNAAGCAP